MILVLSISFSQYLIEKRSSWVYELTGYKIPSTLIFLNFNTEMITQMIYFNDYDFSDKRLEDRKFSRNIILYLWINFKMREEFRNQILNCL